MTEISNSDNFLGKTTSKIVESGHNRDRRVIKSSRSISEMIIVNEFVLLRGDSHYLLKYIRSSGKYGPSSKPYV